MSQIDVFVLGFDEANERTLSDVPDSVHYRFHPLLHADEIQQDEPDVSELLRQAEHRLDIFDGDIGAIIGYWDFPVSTLLPILCRKYGLPSADLKSILKCEHKYWSRLEQQMVITDIPRFDIVDPETPHKPTGLRYPLWLKPVKSFSSELAFKVTDNREFDAAIREIDAGIDRLSQPFEYIMDFIDLPPEIADIGARACLAEEAMHGRQAATEGYVHNGNIVVYGVLDSLNYPGTSSFLRHQYPSQLPAPMVRRMREISATVIEQIGLDNVTFSIEFFCDTETDDVRLLEINPRHSQSHAELFEYVDGVPNHYCMLSVALGRDPQLPNRKGPYEVAAKWLYRRFEDALVTRAPTKKDIDAAQEKIPGLLVDIKASEGSRLSELPEQDSYSYELAHVYIGADSEAELERKYDDALAALPFEFAAE